MEKYTIYCSEEQTKKALKLGAKIRFLKYDELKEHKHFYRHHIAFAFPTAEQMIGWLEERGMNFTITYNPFDDVKIIITKCGGFDEIANIKWNKSKKTAVLAAIDAALEYLENLKQ